MLRDAETGLHRTAAADEMQHPPQLLPRSCAASLHDARQAARLGHRGHVPVFRRNSTLSAARAILVDCGRGLNGGRYVAVLKVNTLDRGDAGDLNNGVLASEIDRGEGLPNHFPELAVPVV